MPTAEPRALREGIVATGRQMNMLGINRGTSGNVSARIDSGFLITPSAQAYEDMTPDDIVAVESNGRASDQRKPSIGYSHAID